MQNKQCMKIILLCCTVYNYTVAHSLKCILPTCTKPGIIIIIYYTLLLVFSFKYKCGMLEMVLLLSEANKSALVEITILHPQQDSSQISAGKD